MVVAYVVAVLVISVLTFKYKVNAWEAFIFLVSLFVIGLIFYGYRDIYSTPDAISYINLVMNGAKASVEVGSLMFFNVIGSLWFIGNERDVLIVLYVVMYLLFAFGYMIALNGNVKLVVLALCVSFLSYEYFDFYSNIIRNGLALSIVLIGVGGAIRGWNKLLVFGLMLISVLFHTSSVLVVLIFIYSYYFGSKSKSVIYALGGMNIVLLIIFLLSPQMLTHSAHFMDFLHKVIIDNDFNFFYRAKIGLEHKMLIYGDVSILNASILYRTVFVVMTMVVIIYILKNINDQYVVVLGLMFMSGIMVYMLFSDMPYHSRMQYLGSFLVPVILVKPLFEKTFNRQVFVFYVCLVAVVFIYRMNKIQYINN